MFFPVPGVLVSSGIPFFPYSLRLSSFTPLLCPRFWLSPRTVPSSCRGLACFIYTLFYPFIHAGLSFFPVLKNSFDLANQQTVSPRSKK
jgi:hypothetical protein